MSLFAGLRRLRQDPKFETNLDYLIMRPVSKQPDQPNCQPTNQPINKTNKQNMTAFIWLKMLNVQKRSCTVIRIKLENKETKEFDFQL